MAPSMLEGVFVHSSVGYVRPSTEMVLDFGAVSH